MGWSISEIVGSGVGAAVKGIATPFSEAWIKTKESAAATHKIDRETDRDITIESYRADMQFSLSQRLLSEADRTHWSTRWMRPAFGALAFVWAAAEVYFWLRGNRPPIELDPIVKYLLAGIIAAIFVLRPYEKGKRTDVVASTAQVPVKPTILSKLTTRRADSQ